MEDKLFCDRVAKGELSKNDILKFAESVEDKVHLCWLLFCRMPSTKTARAETECERLSMAMAWIQTEYGFDWDGEYQDERTIKPIDDAKELAQCECSELPKELQSDDAKKFFAKAIDLGLMSESYEWKKGLQLLACFAREMSLHLNMGKGYNADGTKRISWKPFEILFDIKRNKLRSNYNDIQKTGQNPSDIDLIDKVFE